MNRELDTILRQLAGGKGPSLLLLHGDDFQVREAAKAILDAVCPEADRAFNLERFDGQTSPWEKIEAALRTPPFFPGKKAVYVEEVSYFASQDRAGDAGLNMLKLWGEGKKEQAARLFMNGLAAAGCSPEQWEKLQQDPSAPRLAELLDIDRSVAEEAAEIAIYCQERGIGWSRTSSGESQRLLEILDEGLPPWAFLLLTAQVDRRTRLYRKFEEKGSILDLTLERRSGRVSRDALGEFLNQRLKEAGKRIEPQAREMILTRAGEQLWSFHQEIEKLLIYVGEEPVIKVADVGEVFLDQGEGWVFDLTGALGQRDALGALKHLHRLLSQGEPPLKLLATIAGEIRKLLVARQLIEGELRSRWRRQMPFNQFQATVLPKGAPLLTRNAYADYMCFSRADNFSMEELLRYLELICQTDIRLKSSGGAPQRVMERLVLQMCRADAN
jgi:DNA polymerase-3 subunit delta